ncbi:MAG: hypothetical protein R3F50_14520 [Gammaproteobacteria bacterium]|jgi:hypothetical protein
MVLVFGPAYFCVLFPASYFIKAQLIPFIRAIEQRGDADSSSLENAGTVIGRLERIIMLTFILLDEYTAVGFVLALKAAYRFKDTDDHARAEYMLMGTFLSLAITIAVGLVAKFLAELL